MAAIGEALQGLISAIVMDYLEHHVDDEFEPVPDDSLKMIGLWLSSHGAESTPPVSSARFDAPADLAPWLSPLVNAGQVFAQRLERHRAGDREVMPVKLIHAIDEFAEAANRAIREPGVMDILLNEPDLHSITTPDEAARRAARRTTVVAAQEFVRAFKPYAASQSLSIGELGRAHAAWYAALLREWRGEP